MSGDQLSSITNVFKNKLFRIPDYQRGYAWQEKQLVDFWEDIVNLPNNLSHYTGMLSLDPIKDIDHSQWLNEKWAVIDNDYEAYYVVDGQQRLTTFIIFIQSAVDALRKLSPNTEDRDIYLDGSTDLSEIVKNFLYINQNRQSTGLKAYKFGYVDDPCYNFLKQKIFHQDIVGDIEDSFYTSNITKAKIFFDENIELLKQQDGFNGIAKILLKAIKKLKFKIHVIDTDFDVYAAFETMNNRGKSLSNLELLKSRLIYLTTLFTENQISDDERIQLRKDIHETWKHVYKQLGKDNNNPLDDDLFLRAHWILRYQFSGKRGNDYASFLFNKEFTVKNVVSNLAITVSSSFTSYNEYDSPVEDKDLDSDISQIGLNKSKEEDKKLTPSYIKDYVVSLNKMASHWFYSYYPERSPYTEEEIKWIDRLNKIHIAYFRPLVVASFLREDIETNQRVNLFKEIERFIFISFRLCGAYETYHQNKINSLIRKFINKEESIQGIIKNLHERIENWVQAETEFNIVPFKSKLQRLFSDGSGYYAWGSLKYFLFEYENFLSTNKDYKNLVDWNMKVKPREISIEHIYPQNPGEKSKWNVDFSSYSESEKTFFRGSLGNLLLLSCSKNAQLQNDDYNIKRKMYLNGSHSETTLANEYKEWNSHTILKRGLDMLSFMEKRWNIKFKDENAKMEVLFLKS